MKGDMTRQVKAKRSGSEGLIPVNKHSCPYYGETSCVSPGGGHYCGGYGGDAPIRGTQFYTVYCLEEKSAGFLPYNWVKPSYRPVNSIRYR